MRRTPSETTAAMMRPELMEIKTHIKSLKKEAEMRLTLDVEAQQSFEFLSEQVHGLRKAFSTLSDVLVEEVDLIRSEAAERHDELGAKIDAQAKGLKAARTELTLLRSEVQTGRAALQTKASALEERLDSMQDDLTVLAQEVAKGGSGHHMLQLGTVQLRAALEEESRERRAESEVRTCIGTTHDGNASHPTPAPMAQPNPARPAEPRSRCRRARAPSCTSCARS